MEHVSAHDPAFEKRYQAAVERARVFSASLEGPSLFERLARLPAPARDAILSQLSTLDLTRLLYEWAAWARPKQDPDLAAVAHRVLFILGGRGGGKTLTGLQRLRRRVTAGARSIAIIGPTLGEVEKYLVTGEGGADGLMTIFPPALRPKYRAHKRTIHFHRPSCQGCRDAECGGAVGYINTAEEPEFRGPNLDTALCDEPGKWKYLKAMWSNIELATRLQGPLPLEIIITGTPVPTPQFLEWIADEETVTILSTMRENAANLDAGFVKSMERKYGGTRLGRQELEGEILMDDPNALFHSTIIDGTRREAPATLEIVVAVDPAISEEPDNDETGIVVVGIDAEGHLYVLADATGRYSPEKWGALVIQAYDQWGAVAVVGERNRGGDLVAANVRAAQERKRGAAAAHAIKVVEVHATKGKRLRAEPVGTLHEQARLHFPLVPISAIEAEICGWNPRIGGVSPNRLDALVWGCWHLARLGEADEVKPDYSAGFVGITEAAAQLQAPRAAAALPGQLSGLSALLGARPGRHSTL